MIYFLYKVFITLFLHTDRLEVIKLRYELTVNYNDFSINDSSQRHFKNKKE